MIYVLSDIHGREDRFNSIMKQIHLKPSDHLYILGDVIDRNEGGIRLLRRIARAKNMTMLLGNHEHMMLDAIDHPNDKVKMSLWQNRNGGDITWAKWKYCNHTYQKEILDYLHELPINIEVSCAGKEWLLVHGAPEVLYEPGDRWNYRDSRSFAVWYRLSEYEDLPEGKTVVFGHTPTEYYRPLRPMAVFHGENRIGIDCGCAYPDGRLACLRLDDGAVFYSKDPITIDSDERT